MLHKDVTTSHSNEAEIKEVFQEMATGIGNLFVALSTSLCVFVYVCVSLKQLQLMKKTGFVLFVVLLVEPLNRHNVFSIQLVEKNVQLNSIFTYLMDCLFFR